MSWAMRRRVLYILGVCLFFAIVIGGPIAYAIAAKFLIPSELLQNKVDSLSEGQKGLLMFARLYAERPDLLILDEPTNHINFRHLPVIAAATSKFYIDVQSFNPSNERFSWRRIQTHQ
jgi:hypothetical protein